MHYKNLFNLSTVGIESFVAHEKLWGRSEFKQPVGTNFIVI